MSGSADKMSKETIKLLFDKLTINQSIDARDDAYRQCAKSSEEVDHIDAEHVYDTLFSTGQPQDHPDGVSALAFVFALIMKLSLHRRQTVGSEPKDYGTLSCFDLSPLYGENEETYKVRRRDGSGMLRPDCFSEDRLSMLPQSVLSLLILWNRFHNYVAKQLLLYNECGKWQDPSKLETYECLTQDDEIFNIARPITCIHFINVIKEDFLKGLLGLPFVEQSDILNVLRTIDGRTNDKEGYPSVVESFFLYDILTLLPPSFTPRAQEWETSMRYAVDPSVQLRDYIGVPRNEKGYFEDSDLARVLFDATETRAGFPDYAIFSDWGREHVIREIKRARTANVCTLNEFRQHLGLEPLKSFQEWNSSLADAAGGLYGDIQKLELYPGLLGEKPFANSSFGFGYTMTWGLIADIVSRIRSDPIYKFGEGELTKWGHKDCSVPKESMKQGCFDSIGVARGSFNAVLPKVLQRTLPHNYPYDNVYCLFPFVVPEKSKKVLEQLPDDGGKKYNFVRPRQMKIKVLRTISAISEVLNDPKTFPYPYKQNLIDFTGGYGYMLGFDEPELHDRDLMITLFSLLPDQGTLRRIGATFARKARENLEQRCTKSEGTAKIDIVKDFIDATCIRWVYEAIYDRHFEDDDLDGLSKSEIDRARQKSLQTESDERECFHHCCAYAVGNVEPEFGWDVREAALATTERLRSILTDKLSKTKDTEPPTLKYVKQMLMEFAGDGMKLDQDSAHTFYDRMTKITAIWPAGHSIDNFEHLVKLKERFEEVEKEKEVQINTARTSYACVKNGRVDASKHFVDNKQLLNDIAQEKVEEQRVLANILGLTVVIPMYFSKGHREIVDRRVLTNSKLQFVLGLLISISVMSIPRKERNLSPCARTKTPLMRRSWHTFGKRRVRFQEFYCGLSHPETLFAGIGQRFGLWRDVAVTRTIKQGHGYPDVVIEAGDRVYADFTWAHNDHKQIPDPDTVKTDRKVDSLLGLGMHKCPAGSFINQTMPEIFRAIFSQEGLSRAEGKAGQLRVVTLHPNPDPWHSEVYLNDGGGFSYHPKKMDLTMNASGSKEPDGKEILIEKPIEKLRGIINRVYSRVITSLLVFIISILSIFKSPSSTCTQSITRCREPLKTIEDWNIETFSPDWFGEPAPLLYRTNNTNSVYKITVVDLDKRDIEIRLWLNEKGCGNLYRGVDLDPAVDCGANVDECINEKFSSPFILVPPGRHTVGAEIREREGSKKFNWGGERQKRVMRKVEECSL
ncbi:hypothetical protein AX15_003143 [Amanita polypyramis BW_CC]|nr:hypothetical protein AX15_003143 [Amanita polypyramis BW_CC]